MKQKITRIQWIAIRIAGALLACGADVAERAKSPYKPVRATIQKTLKQVAGGR
jgi:hypothetical protein